MVQINRLRVSGFKSFVDKTELDIGGGLNGIVGPNGCGKSNLVEALRWVMGENRAKQMRGGEMEDVIFAGTVARPARSIAEVSVILDNTDGKAPAPFGNSSQIEVTRRIEKDKGSQYLVNGKVVRARDVQLLFADSLTGAHSPALVSQGRVTQLIQSKPAERRQMLEESAGVASLYTRRHEAELRLKAADENLARLDLVLNEMTARADSLRNQATQALRYRELSDTIRRLESLMAWQDWGSTRDKLKKEETRFTDTDAQVREALTKSSELTRASADAAEAVEDRRKEDTQARAALQLLRHTAEQMEREAAQRRNEYADLTRQIEQGTQDLELATEQRDALRDRAGVIAADLEKIKGEDSGASELDALEAEYARLQDAVREKENDVLSLQDRIRRAKSERDNAKEALVRANTEEERSRTRLEALEENYADAARPSADEDDLAQAASSAETLKAERNAAEEKLTATQSVLDSAREDYAAAREALSALQQAKTLKNQEIDSLNQLLNKLSQNNDKSALLSLDIPADLALAVASAAGDAALRAGDQNWTAMGNAFGATDWPKDVTPLQTLINAPAMLNTFVSSIGVVDDQDGQRLAQHLSRGQVLVSRTGALWRWDGLNVPATSENAEARILGLRAQARDAQNALNEFDPKIEQAQAALHEQTSRRDALIEDVGGAQKAARSAAAQLQDVEKRIDALQKTVNDRAIKRTLLEEQCNNAIAQTEAAQTARKDAQERLNALETQAQDDTLRAELQKAEISLEEHRTARDEQSVKVEAVKAALTQAKQLQSSLEAEATRTADQIVRIGAQAQSLNSRIETLRERKTALDPLVANDESGAERQTFLDRITAAEETVRNASDAFAIADANAKSLAQDLKKIEESGAALRERRAVIQATVAALQNEQTRIASEIEDRFATSPAALETAVMAEWPEGVPSISKARSERDFLTRERDAMGPVNLRADIELQETEAEHVRLSSEKTDLAAAIERLREGIGKLNEEARERLVKTFTAVDEHFQKLFQRLFGGGEAHLKLEGADDPLECGLEIYAQPPGKHLQSLNLLSGGEQTLTALSMIFAMFLSNPAPVCVLDEVDAPLDDANVDRVCTLLEEMAANCATRFLIITHHRMTMARMDRLYGVTMAERGVSQLVSVNLAAQGDLLEQHKAA